MIKAIKVNNQTIIGVPKQWVRPSSPEHTTLGYHTLPDAEHFADGWKQVVTPVYNSSIEKLGELIEYPDRFEYSVQPLTQQQIDTNLQNQEELEDEMEEQENENKGLELVRRMRKRIRRRIKKGVLNDNQGQRERRWFSQIFFHLRNGDWDLADQDINSETFPTTNNTDINNDIDWLKAKIKDFIEIDYSK